jgi:predicted GNAT superfamily acetyltransferase
MMFRIADLTTLDEFRQVEQLEGLIWGRIDLVPVPILAVTVRRGAVLVGAWDADQLVGFVYSFPALRRGESVASHWSHMLGVHPDQRGAGLGRALKLAQRERVLALGLDLIEWTFDPLQAENAHLNFVKLGVVVEEYEENVYGESPSPLHGGLPTDRFVCQWWIRRPHVERRLTSSGLTMVASEAARAPVVNRIEPAGRWIAPAGFDAARGEPRVAVDIPAEYTTMLRDDPVLALRWRLETRAIFTRYLAAEYRVVDFAQDEARARGRYLLTTIRPAD